MDIKEVPPILGLKEALIMQKEPIEENIVIIQGMNSKGLHHKEDHSLPGMQICFMVIVFIVLILDIRLQIARIIKEMFKQEVSKWLHVTLSVTNVITMDT